MKKKGFTLIELLGVITILAIIALITVPIVLGVIEKTKKAAFQDSIYGIIESAHIYLASNIDKISKKEEITFTCNGISCSNSNGEQLEFKGSVPKSGSFYVSGDGSVIVESVYNGRYYANSVEDDIEITDEDTTLTRTELTNMIKELQQEVRALKQQINNKSDASQLASIQAKHESDVTSIWNKVGVEDLSSISEGSISKILIENNELISNLNRIVTNQVSQINQVQTSLNANTTSINNLSSQHNSDINTINNRLGTTSISTIGNGTITGAISSLKTILSSVGTYYESNNYKETSIITGEWVNLCSLTIPAGTYVGYAQMAMSASVTDTFVAFRIEGVNLIDYAEVTWNNIYKTIPIALKATKQTVLKAYVFQNSGISQTSKRCEINLVKVN